MKTMDIVHEKITTMTNYLVSNQSAKGAWNFCFEGSIMTDAYMIILIRVLEIKDEEELVKRLVERIKRQSTCQETAGWGLESLR
jgi:sporulenol synthase